MFLAVFMGSTLVLLNNILKNIHNYYKLILHSILGVFFWIGYYLWNAVGSPEHTTSGIPSTKLKIKQRNVPKEYQERIFKAGLDKYPMIDLLRKQEMSKPEPSPRYGDFTDENHRNHYLEGNCYPHIDVLSPKNSIMKRSQKIEKPMKGIEHKQDSTKTTEKLIENQITYETVEEEDYNYSRRSKAVRPPDSQDISQFMDFYESHEFQDTGTLFVNKTWMKKKWNMRAKTWKLKKNFTKYPPIIIPSRGRASTALLDLNSAMENDHDYIEIVVVSTVDRDDYLKALCNHFDIDVFVIPPLQRSEKQTAGRARHFSKRLAELITQDTDIRFYLTMDDNVCSWQGITLVNDPNPLFDSPPTNSMSQKEDISLHKVLSHFSLDMLNAKMSEFSAIGFLNNSKFDNKKLVNAYGRKHVFEAVIQNLEKLEDVHYREKLWCMEDLFFNDDTTKKDGVIVKCQRFLVKKMSLGHGGVVPEDVPPEVQQEMMGSEYWSDVKVLKTKKKMLNASRDSSFFIPRVKQALNSQEVCLKKAEKCCFQVIFRGEGPQEDLKLAKEILEILSNRDLSKDQKYKQIRDHEIFKNEGNTEVRNNDDTSRQGEGRKAVTGKSGPRHQPKNTRTQKIQNNLSKERNKRQAEQSVPRSQDQPSPPSKRIKENLSAE